VWKQPIHWIGLWELHESQSAVKQPDQRSASSWPKSSEHGPESVGLQSDVRRADQRGSVVVLLRVPTLGGKEHRRRYVQQPQPARVYLCARLGTPGSSGSMELECDRPADVASLTAK